MTHEKAVRGRAGLETKAMTEKVARPKAMSLTEAAAARVREIMTAKGADSVGLRVGVKNGGCAGMSYTMEIADRIEKYDEVVEDKGVKVLIDPKAVLFLLGTEMDFKSDKLSSTFVFNNPNQIGSCGCGESVTLTPAGEGAAALARH
jgi:iron-sulfur cluster assembly protein